MGWAVQRVNHGYLARLSTDVSSRIEPCQLTYQVTDSWSSVFGEVTYVQRASWSNHCPLDAEKDAIPQGRTTQIKVE